MNSKCILLAMLGIVVVIFIIGLILSLNSEKTGGQIVQVGRRPCFATQEDACARTIQCDDWNRAVPVSPQPMYTRAGYVTCKCLGKHPETKYYYVRMCA